VLRDMYRSTYKKGRGYTAQDWWSAVSRAAGGRSFADFNAKYIDGREPLPYDQVFPLAGLRIKADTLREPRLGLGTGQDSSGAIVVRRVVPDSPAAAAGVKEGDVLLALGDVAVDNPDFGRAYRARFNRSEGDSLPIRVVRGTDTLTLHGKVVLGARIERRLEAAPDASPKAVRIRNGILRGKMD
jgi:predicted metalloprotease with PDZ domain